MEKVLIRPKEKTFNSYSDLFEKTLKKTIFKKLIENASSEGFLDATIASEITAEIERMQEYEIEKA